MLKSKKISEASPLEKIEVSPSVLVPAYDGTDNPRSLSVSVFQETVLEEVIKSDLLVKVSDLQENYYNKQEVDDLIAPLQPEKVDELI